MSNGMSATGFLRKRLDEILGDMQSLFKSVFGDNLNVTPESPDGQIIGGVSESFANLWEIAEAAYNAFNPSGATDAALSNLVQINGIVRREAIASTVVLTVTGANGVTVPLGSLITTSDGSVTFATDADVIIPIAGFIDVDATATVTGPIPAVIGTVIEIDTPVTGWDSVTNAADAVLGVNEESDPELRSRRERSVAKAAKGILDTIIAEVLEIEGVTEAFIFENILLTTDPDTNTPGKSFQVVALGGSDSDIATAIFDEKPIGIESYGTTVIPVLDSQAVVHDIGFTRPSAVPIFIIVNLSTFVDFPVDGADTIKQNIVDYADGELVQGRKFGVSEDVIQTELYTPVNAVQGHSITSILIGIVDPPVAAVDIEIAFDEISEFNVINITVNEIPA